MKDKNLYIQICNDFGNVMYSYKTHINKAALLQKHKKWIMRGQILLSAASSTGIINVMVKNNGYYTFFASLCGFALFLLNVYMRKVNFTEEIDSNYRTSNALWRIREQYMDLLSQFYSTSFNIKDIVRDYKSLQHDTGNIYENAPIAGGKSYLLARHQLQNNDQYFSIDELNQILPPNLRIKY